MTSSTPVRRTAGIGATLMAALVLSACSGEPESAPTETVVVTQAPRETTRTAADPADPFGGMAAVSGSVSAAEACRYISAFRDNLPSNVENDPRGAQAAVSALRSAAPQELSGNLRGLENILTGFAQGNQPLQAVEGKLTGLSNQCRGLAEP